MSADTYSIRPAQLQDLDRLTELLLSLQDHLEACNPDLWRMNEDARKSLKGQIHARLTTENGLALVADHEASDIIGVIFGRIIVNKRYTPSRAGQIDQVFVSETHRRARVASRLVGELCRYFAEKNVDDLSLRYVAGNEEAASFWTDLGFTPRIINVGARREDIEHRIRYSEKPSS